MQEAEISERVVVLKSEVASLLQSDEAYKKNRRKASTEGQEHIRRMERVQRILEELSDLKGRKHPPSW